jgi:hypothetical protein
MLVYGNSEEAQRAGGGIMAEWERNNRACLGFQPGVRDFRGNVTVRPFQGVQAGSLRDFNPSFRKH